MRTIVLPSFYLWQRISGVVYYLHRIWSRLGPHEADPIPVVDPNAVLSLSVPGKRFQPIPWGHAQFVERDHGIE
jgi:hypothetical protein